MKFSCAKVHLERALAVAERFTGKNVTLPVLGNVLLETRGNTLTVSATNLEYAVEVLVPGRGFRDDKVSVSAKVASSLVQSVKEEKIELEGRQGSLLLKSGTRDTRINGLPTDDFPLLPKIKKTGSFSVEGALLRNALEHVLPAVSPSEFKPELAGVNFLASGGILRLAATDTFRLAEAVSVLPKKGEKDSFSFILPQRTSQEIARTCGDEDGEVSIIFGENQVEFGTPSLRIISRLIEGRFPDYAAIIPKKFETSCFLNRKELLDVARAASIFASKLQEVSLAFENGVLKIAATNPDVGEYRTELPAPLSGKSVQVSFNYRYLLDGLNSLEEEEIFFGINGHDGPALIRNKSGQEFLYVLMPIRLT